GCTRKSSVSRAWSRPWTTSSWSCARNARLGRIPTHHDDGAVVGGLEALGELVGLLEQVVFHGARGGALHVEHEPGEPLLAELLALAVPGLGEAVGENHQPVVGLEVGGALLVDR